MKDYDKFKKCNEKKIIIIKSGIFYYVYNEDAIIVNYLTGYKLYYLNNKKLCVSFTDKSLNSVLYRIRLKTICYIVLDKTIKQEYIGILSSYEKVYEEASLMVNKDVIIDNILDKLRILSLEELEKVKKFIERN